MFTPCIINRKVNFRFLFTVATAGLIFFSTSVSAILIQYPTAANHVHKAFDPAGSPAPDSFVVLAPDPVHNANEFFSLTSVSQGVKDELDDNDGDGKSDGDTKFNGWTFDYGFDTLAGTIFIDEYKAEYKGPHHGGGKINLRYEKGAGDPDNLRWIQLITTTNPLNNATSPYIDPFPNDGTDGAPFYWHSGEIGGQTNGSNTFGDFDLHFFDFSSRIHPLPVPFDPIIWIAELYLVEYDGTKGVTFHDGINWGWEMHPAPAPVPEPSSIFLFCIGAVVYIIIRKRKIFTPLLQPLSSS